MKAVMVRACALGALGYLCKENHQRNNQRIFDSNLEVQKSAIHAAIKLGFKIPKKK